MTRPKYIEWLIEETGVVLENSHPITCYSLNYTTNDEIFDDWALHLRRHYESDDSLYESMLNYDMTIEQYLRKFVIPQKNDLMGPTSRSNDITEILISDLLEFILNYTVPRCKQENRSGKASSEHGTDIIAYKFYKINKIPNSNDELIATEVKANLTSNTADGIKSAIEHSLKDEQRLAHTINYYRKKLKYLGKESESKEIARFSQKPEIDYKITYIAAAVSSQETVDKNITIEIKGEELELKTNQKVFYVHGKDLMNLTHTIYERCVK